MKKEYMEYIKEEASKYFYIPTWEEIPDIDLYLDQVVTLLEEYLRPFSLEPEDKVITKTMINNYVKQNIISAPVNKKYNKEQVAMLFVICMLKQVYSINDISRLIKLSFKNNEPSIAYTKFADELRLVIKEIFEEKKGEDKPKDREEQIILQNVVNSFVSKLYVRKEFLYK